MSTETPLNARRLIEYVAEHAIKLAIVRNSLLPDDWESDEDMDEDAIVKDTVDCLVGDDCGCLEPDDPRVMEVVNRVEAFAAERGRAVLAEAERALRDRAAKVAPVEPIGEFDETKADGLTEAADLLAGMRGDK